MPGYRTLKIKQCTNESVFPAADSPVRISGRPGIGSISSLASEARLLRKEVIQPHLPIRLPCYDFTPITNPTFGGALLAVKLPTSGVVSSHGVTGGVYKARERIHGSMLTCHY